MATDAELIDLSVPDRLSCPLCSESLLDRNPRFLSCTHYFCQRCLEDLCQDGLLPCPTCKQVTPLTYNDVTTLIPNLTLPQEMEKERKVEERYTPVAESRQCQICDRQEATHICKDCDQVLCDRCSDTHNTMIDSKHHKVFKLCQSHKDALDLVCMQCLTLACSNCIGPDHADHSEHIEVHETATKQLDERYSVMASTLKILQGKIGESEDKICEKEILIGREINQYEKRRNNLEYQIAVIDSSLQLLKDSKSQCKQELNSSKENKEKCASLLESSKYRGFSCEDILSEYVHMRQELDSLSHSIDKMDKFVGITPYTGDGESESFEMTQTQGSASTSVYEESTATRVEVTSPLSSLLTPEIRRSIRRNECFKVIQPHGIVVTRTGEVIVTDTGTRKFNFLNRNGDFDGCVEGRIDLGTPRAAAVYKNDVYLANAKGIMKFRNDYGKLDSEVIYKPGIKSLHKIAVVRDDLILCTGLLDASVFEFNPLSGSLRTVLERQMGPSYINVAHTEEGDIYILTLEGSTSVHVYDSNWNLLFAPGARGSMGELVFPMDSCGIPGGILIADKDTNCIILYDNSGKYIMHLLTAKDGIKQPLALAFKSPYLWISQDADASIKCFKIFPDNVCVTSPPSPKLSFIKRKLKGIFNF